MFLGLIFKSEALLYLQYQQISCFLHLFIKSAWIHYQVLWIYFYSKYNTLPPFITLQKRKLETAFFEYCDSIVLSYQILMTSFSPYSVHMILDHRWHFLYLFEKQIQFRKLYFFLDWKSGLELARKGLPPHMLRRESLSRLCWIQSDFKTNFLNNLVCLFSFFFFKLYSLFCLFSEFYSKCTLIEKRAL